MSVWCWVYNLRMNKIADRLNLVIASTFVISIFFGITTAQAESGKYKSDLNSAKQAMQRGDGERALLELSRLAGEGDSEAQYELGMLYADGKLIKRDSNRALLALTLAFENGLHKAGVERNRQAAKINLIQLAALQEQLAELFKNGGPVKVDPTREANWLGKRVLNPVPFNSSERSEERGAMARRAGNIFELQILDFTTAHIWYSLSYALGNRRAELDRKRMELFLQPQSISKAQSGAMELYKKYLTELQLSTKN